MIADIHCHISTKPMFLKKADKNCNEQLEFNIFGCVDEILGGDVVDSQSCINQQLAGAVSFSINPLYSLEQNIGNNSNVKLLTKDKQVDGQVISSLANGITLFHDHLKKEYDLVLKEKQSAAKDFINIITATNKKLELGKLNILTSIEGIHSLYSSQAHYDGDFQDSFFVHIESELQRLVPAYLTLSHMHQNGLFSFCNGSKMNKKNEEQWFLPYDRGFQGLNNNCERILQICEDNNVAIDLKHTSFANRLAIYEFIFDHDHAAPIASHCGVAFMTFTDYLVNNKLSIRRRPIWPHPIDAPDPDLSRWPRTIELEVNRAKGPLNLFANCAQINLFDEDIVAIMSLGGLIGVSFDQRILGATALKNATRKQIDQMSPEDGNFIMAEYNTILQKLNIDLPLLDNAQIGLQNAPEGQNLFQDIAEIHRPTDKHFDYFIQTILYLLKVGYEHKIDNPWLYISMGSDFDGLIDAINVCKSSTKLPSLRTKMIDYFKKNKNKKDVLKKVQADGIDMTQMVNQFMFFNAVEHFSDQMGLDGQEFINGAVPG